MSMFGMEAPQKSFLRSAFDAVASRTKWAVLGAGLLAGAGLATLDDNSNLCVSYQSLKGSRNFCVGVSALFDSTAQNAPTAAQSPMTGAELEDYLTRPAKPGTAPAVPATPSIPPSGQGEDMPGSRIPSPDPEMSPDSGKPPIIKDFPSILGAPLTPEQQEATRKRIEWFENPCNPRGRFQTGIQINQLLQRPAPTCT